LLICGSLEFQLQINASLLNTEFQLIVLACCFIHFSEHAALFYAYLLIFSLQGRECSCYLFLQVKSQFNGYLFISVHVEKKDGEKTSFLLIVSGIVLDPNPRVLKIRF
jgi:hypothetical protein